MKKIFVITAALLAVVALPAGGRATSTSGRSITSAQDHAPVSWNISASPAAGSATSAPAGGSATSTSGNGGGRHTVTLTARIAPGWHIYDLVEHPDGPVPTTLVFGQDGKTAGYRTVGALQALDKPVVKYDASFGTDIGTYASSARFAQTVEVVSRDSVMVVVTVGWMACREGACTPPQEAELAVTLPGNPQAQVVGGGGASAANAAGSGNAVVAVAAGSGERASRPGLTASAAQALAVPSSASASLPPTITTRGVIAPAIAEGTGGSMWAFILEAILWGLAALLTPCVFPMVPMTVSYFLTSTGSPRRNAALYGLFIVALYTIPIAVLIGLTRLIGGGSVTADIFNWLATHWIPNVLFFLVFIVFAASFFGAFEIVLPQWLTGKAGAKSDRAGIGGIFFMALTLVLVSFSCTGPIIGTVLIKSTAGEVWAPVVTMLAFSLAFALPFVLLALFPTLLDKMPKSGGWLNSVKVSLGFIEIALGLKFLSVADQVYHWNILPRELYLAIWIVVFAMLGFYLLGKLRFRHDSEVQHIGVGRLFLAIVVFTFTLSMVPGLFGAPLRLLSGYLPPLRNDSFVMGEAPAEGTTGSGVALAGGGAVDGRTVKYGDKLQLPHGLQGFFDLDEGLEYAHKITKPVFLDITGHGCVNCREMEANVWSDPRVLELLRDKFVIVALYTDDKMDVPEADWLTTSTGKVLKSLGRINSYIVQTRFGAQAQPLYLVLDPNGRELVPRRAYSLDIPAFEAFLQSGIDAFDNLQD